MTTSRSDLDAVYVGPGWLLYASRALKFDLSESAAPCALVGRPDRNLNLTLSDSSHLCGPLLLHAAGVWSAMEASPGAVLYLDPLTPAGAALQRSCAGAVVPSSASDALTGLAARLEALYQGGVEPNDLDALVERWTRELLVSTACAIDPRLLHLRDWLIDHREGRVDVAAMARLVGLSADHLRQLFRRQLDMNLSSYMAWLRLFSMSALLCETVPRSRPPDTVTLMQAAGYYDASHASRAMRRYLDLKPSEMLTPGHFVDCRPGMAPRPG